MSQPSSHSTPLTPDEARGIAKDAFIYGFPMAANYQTMYKQAMTRRIMITAEHLTHCIAR